jgi:hypothetical protein
VTMRATWWADPRLKRCQTCAAMEAEVEQLQEELDRMLRFLRDARPILGMAVRTGSNDSLGARADDLIVALSSLSEQEGNG